jgi:hypothetical protein
MSGVPPVKMIERLSKKTYTTSWYGVSFVH